jgi:hypothetical protein
MGWWQACPESGAGGYDPFDTRAANLNLVLGNEAVDPISGSVPHRAYVCDLRPGDIRFGELACSTVSAA